MAGHLQNSCLQRAACSLSPFVPDPLVTSVCACMMVPLVHCHVWRPVTSTPGFRLSRRRVGRSDTTCVCRFLGLSHLGVGAEESAHNSQFEDGYTQHDELLEVCSIECPGMKVSE